MPQLRLEYSANVDIDFDLVALFGELHSVLVEVGAIKLENCKSRAYRAEPFLVADGSPGADGRARGFVHLDIRFIEGRSEEVKQAIGAQSRDRLLGAFSTALKKLDLQVTVEIRDIERASYCKYPEGTLTSQ